MGKRGEETCKNGYNVADVPECAVRKGHSSTPQRARKEQERMYLISMKSTMVCNELSKVRYSLNRAIGKTTRKLGSRAQTVTETASTKNTMVWPMGVLVYDHAISRPARL